MMEAGKLISREEVLVGFKGGVNRRARSVLSLIEARAARIVLERGSVNSPFATESALETRNQTYLSAICESVNDDVKVSVFNLERTATDWQDLVPESPEIRAELAYLLSQRYAFRRRNIPNTSRALGLARPEVQAAYASRMGQPFITVFKQTANPLVQLRWAWERLSSYLEDLPPFWTAFALTLTEVVGAGTLALPIAFATIGPLAGLMMLLVFGAVNLLTVGYLAEASTRNGQITFGSAFIGQLVKEFLGPFAALIARLSLFFFCCNILVSYYTGFGSTLGAITHLPNTLWVVAIFGFGVCLVLRRSLIGTVSSALVIGFINISILIILSVVALRYFDVSNATSVNALFLFNEPFDPSIIQLAFGIVMTSYFGHVSVSNCAQAVLRRDPDGRSLKTGTMAAMCVAIIIYSVWVITIGSAIDPARLKSETGTVLVPLAEKAGLGVYVLGTVFVILGLGMSSVHFSLGIYNMAREVIAGLKPRLTTTSSGRISRSVFENVVALSPIICIFAYVQWSFLTGQQSFIKPLELNGVLMTPILAGVFPVLLLIASRRRGRAVEGARLPWVFSNPWVLSFIALLFFSSLLLHGVLIWSDPVFQTLAFGTSGMLLICVLGAFKAGKFKPLLLVELHHYEETGDHLNIHVSTNGEPIEFTSLCEYQNGTSVVGGRWNFTTERFSECSELSISFSSPGGVQMAIQAFHINRFFEKRVISGSVNVIQVSGQSGEVNVGQLNQLFREPSQAGKKILKLRCDDAYNSP